MRMAPNAQVLRAGFRELCGEPPLRHCLLLHGIVHLHPLGRVQGRQDRGASLGRRHWPYRLPRLSRLHALRKQRGQLGHSTRGARVGLLNLRRMQRIVDECKRAAVLRGIVHLRPLARVQGRRDRGASLGRRHWPHRLPRLHALCRQRGQLGHSTHGARVGLLNLCRVQLGVEFERRKLFSERNLRRGRRRLPRQASLEGRGAAAGTGRALRGGGLLGVAQRETLRRRRRHFRRATGCGRPQLDRAPAAGRRAALAGRPRGRGRSGAEHEREPVLALFRRGALHLSERAWGRRHPLEAAPARAATVEPEGAGCRPRVDRRLPPPRGSSRGSTGRGGTDGKATLRAERWEQWLPGRVGGPLRCLCQRERQPALLRGQGAEAPAARGEAGASRGAARGATRGAARGDGDAAAPRGAAGAAAADLC
mmetsp:Transcript_90775/g.293044  ORF Transcript_90775/g.293044 Transcript_90775/m.293044 type:complete len:423 (+) Transcript_90775:1028-2296(+)